MLQRFRDDSSHSLIATLKLDARTVVLLLEVRERLLTQPTASHYKRAETLASHVRAFLLEPVVPLHDLRHDDVRTLLQERDLTRLSVAHDDAHALRLGGEREDLENVEGDTGAGGGL